MSCDHCNHKYLAGMVDVSKPGSLLAYARKLDERGGRGMLISGGSDMNGMVLYRDHHFQEMKAIKKETSLLLNLHTGLITPDTARRLGEIGVDTVSFDVLGDEETIDRVLHLKSGPLAYRRTYKLLVDAGIKVVPHVLAGFNFGRLSGELNAVDLISEFSPDTAVLIILIPTKNTPMENVDPLPEDEIVKVGRYMREKLESDLLLGCMRPRSYRKLEMDLIDIGFSGIVIPRRETVDWIKSRGWEIMDEDICCAIPSL